MAGFPLHSLAVPQDSADQSAGTEAVVRSLPVYAKYMLVAGYLASYLPPRLDLKHFTQLDRRNVSKQALTGADAANVEPKVS